MLPEIGQRRSPCLKHNGYLHNTWNKNLKAGHRLLVELTAGVAEDDVDGVLGVEVRLVGEIAERIVFARETLGTVLVAGVTDRNLVIIRRPVHTTLRLRFNTPPLKFYSSPKLDSRRRATKAECSRSNFWPA